MEQNNTFLGNAICFTFSQLKLLLLQRLMVLFERSVVIFENLDDDRVNLYKLYIVL